MIIYVIISENTPAFHKNSDSHCFSKTFSPSGPSSGRAR